MILIPGRLTVIVGLPGSGKSTLVEERRSFTTGRCVHDFHANADDDSPLVEKSRHYHAVLDDLRAGNNCVIADIAFCESQRRASLREAFSREIRDVEFEWIYFENALGKCERNIRRRARPNVLCDLRELGRLAPLYCIPAGETPRIVWEGDPSHVPPELP